MQHRMKTYKLTQEEILRLMERSSVGCLATINPDGSPYNTPIHFVGDGEKIYFHGLPKGKKLDNIKSDQRVCLCIYEMVGLLPDPDKKPCDTNTEYESIILSGTAVIVKEIVEKNEALNAIVKKYTPDLVGSKIPDNMLSGTAVIRIDVTEITGKYYS